MIKENGRYVSKAVYTTNAVEAVHRQFRRLTKTKDGFSNENSLLKLLYAGILNAKMDASSPKLESHALPIGDSLRRPAR